MEGANSMLRTLLLALVCSTPASVARAQSDPVLASRAEYAEAVRAHQAHDHEAFLQHARRAEELRPEHGGVVYALATAYALTGDDQKAVGTLRRFATLGYFADVAADSDLVRLRGSAGYAEVLRALEANRLPVIKSTVAFTLPERDLLTEGIAYDPAGKAFFLGSVHHRKIVRVDPAGQSADFVRSGRDSLWAPLGMQVDPVRRTLWVAAGTVPQMLGFDSSDAGRSGLFRYDLSTGALTGRIIIPPDSTAHLLGDLTLAHNGDIYASDSRAPVVWRLRAGADSLERFVESALILSAQGLALSEDGRALFLADYSRGILKIDLATRQVTHVPGREGVVALGIDGLYRVGQTLIGIQNGLEPHRVVRLRLAARGDSVIGLEVLERLHPAHAEPTLGVLVGRDLYYVANSQWERFGDAGAVARPEELAHPAVLRLRL
jgi:sugar lactone lactonase YvrE